MRINYNNNSSRAILGILAVLLLVVVIMIWHFTSQNGQVSHSTSISVIKIIENAFSENFTIKQTEKLDELVRKGTHFCEYMLLGLITCLFLYMFFRKVWLSTAISFFICPIYALLDEYRQNFIPGRTFRWFDWGLDVGGAIFGIIIATVIAQIIWYIYKLKKRINHLEEELEQNRDRRR